MSQKFYSAVDVRFRQKKLQSVLHNQQHSSAG